MKRLAIAKIPNPITDDLVKSLKTVTPAEAGVQNSLNLLDSRFRGNDKNGEITTFYETIITKIHIKTSPFSILPTSPFYSVL